MKRAQGVYRRGDSDVWQFARKAPKELAHHFPGGWARRCSLETSDLREANARAAVLWVETDEQFARLRRADNPQPVALNPALAAAIAAEVRRWALAADDSMRDFPEGPRALLIREARERIAQELPELEAAFVVPTALQIGAPTVQAKAATLRDPLEGMSEAEAGALARFNAASEAAAAIDTARRNLRPIRELADAVARSMGLAVDWTTDEGRAGLAECLKAYRAALSDLVRRDAGDVVNTPELAAGELPVNLQAAQAQAQAAAAGHSFRDAWQAWNDEEPGRVRKTVQTYEATANKLAELLPGRTVETMTRADAAAVRAALLREAEERGGGTARNTARNLLMRATAMLNVAKRLDWITANPFDGARSIEAVKSDREDWTPSELAKLFADPLFTEYRLPDDSRAGGAAAYFVPLLALYTGARISELAQLHTDDIEEDPDDEGRPVLRMRADRAKGQRLKTTESKRRIPMHSELVRLGLVDYWRMVKAAGPGPLFPAIKRRKDGDELNGAGGKLSEWFGDYKTAKGFDKTKVFHSLRHTMQTRLVLADVDSSIADALSGRSAKSVGARHYLHTRPVDMRPFMEKLTYPGLHLPRVFKTPRQGLLADDEGTTP